MTFKIKDSLSVDGSVVIDQSKNITANDLTVNGTLTANGSAVQPQLVSGSNIKTINGTSVLGSGDLTISSLPAQTSNSGKFLTTDGSNASWLSVVDDSSTTSTTVGWSASKLNTTLGDIDAALAAIIG